MASETDRLVTIVEVVDKYSKELQKMREEYKKSTDQLEKMGKQVLNVGKEGEGSSGGLGKLVGSFVNLKTVLATAGISLAVNTLKNIGLKAINAASDMAELENVTRQVFENSTAEIQRWADNIDSSVGRSIYKLQNYASIYGSMFKGAGFETEVFKEWSKDLTKLTADFSSFFNIADDEAFTAIKGVLTGESEAMKRYGFILNETTMAEYAHAQGIQTKWSKLSEAEKMQLRYNALMEKTKHIHGDAERTIDGYANQLKVAEGHISNISVGLGKQLIPAAEGVLHMFNGLAEVVDDFINKKSLDDIAWDFQSEIMQLEDLKDRYVELSQIQGRSPEEEKERLSIISKLNALYPGLLGNISSEATNYAEVANAIDGVIVKLQEKMLMQMQESVLSDIMKTAEKEFKKVEDIFKRLREEKEEFLKLNNFSIDEISGLDKVKAKFEEALKDGLSSESMEKYTNELNKVVGDFAKIKGMNSEAQENLIFRVDRLVQMVVGSEEEIATKQAEANKEISKKVDEGYEKINYILKTMSISDKDNNSIFSRINDLQIQNGKQFQAIKDESNKKIESIGEKTEKGKQETIEKGRKNKVEIIENNQIEHNKTRNEIKNIGSGVNSALNIFKNSNSNNNANNTNKNTATQGNVKKAFERTSRRTESDLEKKALSNSRKALSKSTSGGSSKSSGGSSGKEEKNKWESMLESLTKSLNDLQIPIDNFRNRIDELNRKINELEVDKLKFSEQYGIGKGSEVIAKQIEGLKKLYETALEARDTVTIQNLKIEIESMETDLVHANIFEGMISDLKKRMDEITFNYNEEFAVAAEKIEDFRSREEEYISNYIIFLKRKVANGILTEVEAQKEIGKLYELLMENNLKLKDFGKYWESLVGKLRQDKDILELEHSEKEKELRLENEIFSKNFVEGLEGFVSLSEEKLEKEIKHLKEMEKKLSSIPEFSEENSDEIRKIDEEATKEKRKQLEIEIEETKEKIKGNAAALKAQKNFLELSRAMASLDFGKSLNESIFKTIESRVIEANSTNEIFSGIASDLSREMDKELEKFGGIVTEEDIKRLRDEIIERQIKNYEEIGKVQEAEILQRIKFNNSLEDMNGRLEKIGNIFSQLASITGSKSLSELGNIINSIKGLGSAYKELNITSMGGLKEFGKSLFKGGFTWKNFDNWLKVGNIATAGFGVVTSILNYGKNAKKAAEQANEQRRQQAESEYNQKINNNRQLVEAIESLTESIQDMSIKLIQNIAENTSDKNIHRQMKYYKELIETTTESYNDKIIASGHTSSRKRKGFRKVTNVYYQTMEKDFSEIFGQLWDDYQKDSESLQRFYDNYVSLFNVDELRRAMGSHTLDKHNMEDVKRNFLNFIRSVREMEDYLLSLDKNGILESFEGVSVTDIFERRKEYEGQLSNIYKSMGRDPEEYRSEIIQKVNELIQGDKVVITAFEQVRSTTVEQLAQGNKAIKGLAEGLEHYFNNLKTNLSKVMYDGYFQNFEEQYNRRFENIANKLADFRLQGGKDIKRFAQENLSFEDLFLQLRSVENINNDMEQIIKSLRQQARNAGLSEDVINSMFPDEKMQEKISRIESALRTAMERALDTSSYNQFTMSLGESIYENVKEGLVTAFIESSKYQQLMEKYFITDEYKSLIDKADSFEEAYKIIKAKQEEAENRLKAQGLDFRSTNAATGEYLGGLMTQEDVARSRISQEAMSLNFNFNLENKGFIQVDDMLSYIKKEVKEFLYKSKKEEV